MVGLDDGPRSRAQLVLVGAVAIAFIILGIVVVFNTVLFTENVDSTGSGIAVDDSEAVERVSADTMGQIARYVNEGNMDRAGRDTLLSQNASNYSTLLQESYAQDSAALVDINYNQSNTKYGVRVFQTNTSDFYDDPDDTGSDNWHLTDSTPSEIVRFEMDLTRSQLSNQATDSFHIAVKGTNETGAEEWRVVRIYNDSGAGIDLAVAHGSGSAPGNWYDQMESPTSACNDMAVGSTFEVDVSEGTVEGTSCTFNFTDGIDYETGSEGYDIWFRDSENASGTYSFVLSEPGEFVSSAQYQEATGTPGSGQYYTDIVWRAGVTVEYDTPTISYRETFQSEPAYNTSR
ncbi:DUF7261 family protein [Haloarchaeobius amylolyticus]|uniref:DUF7261 family protein n=1 Tax=Haloarchaeobius amylolyticus TaxID=1198296 RepID=UPI00227165E7|nr:hypothetical protein [Haloarchaeobius amylolyticus]